MKVFKSLSAIALILMGVSMASCISDKENSYKATSTIGNIYNAVVDLSTNEVTLFENASFTIEWDYVKSTANVDIQGLRFPGSVVYPKIQMTDVPWTVNNKGWMQIALSDYSPASYGGNLVFNNFNFQIVNRTFNNAQFSSCLNISYTVNNQYRVCALPTQLAEFGTTSITNSQGQTTQYNNADSPVYYFVFDPVTKNCYMVIQNAPMPNSASTQHLKVATMPFNVSPYGIVTAFADEVNVAALSANSQLSDAGTPLDNMKVTNFSFNYNPSYGIIMNYNYRVTDSEGIATSDYHVEFETIYPDASTNQ